MRVLAICVAGSLLAGCNGIAANGLPALSPKGQATITDIVKISTTDIGTALTMAKASNDAAAVQCFTFLGPFVTQQAAQLTGGSGTSIGGVVSGFEAARLLVQKGQALASAGLPDAINQNCGWLAASEALDINTLLLSLASKAAPAVGLPNIPLPSL